MSAKEQPEIYKPSKEFSKHARVSSMAEYRRLWRESLDDPEKFWGKQAEALLWRQPWKKVLTWKAPDAQWFLGGRLNVCENCVDRHALGERRNKAAIIFEGEHGDQRTITYSQLHREVCQFANVLLGQGIRKGDRVLIYMPMIPETVVAMLACARLGAIHSVVFGGFSADSIADRLNDSEAKVIVTADGGWRRGKVVPLKENVDAALARNKTVKSVIVCERTKNKVTMKKGRDHWWHELSAGASAKHEAKAFDSEHPLYLLYTSGSTGKPKGILHTSAGYLLYNYLTTKYIFDLRDEDVYWCTADVGWVTGHSYVVYGPLAAGATQVIYEGAPNYPDWGRFWQIVEEHRISILYTAPTAIRAFIKAGDEFVDRHDLSSLRLLGSVGEPINPEAWRWYYKKVGGSRCPIVDTWWQTETGGIMISPLPGATPLPPGSGTFPFFGIDAAVLDEDGKECKPGVQGRLVIRKPWPSMLRTIYHDRTRFKKTYWSNYPGYYTSGDSAFRDKQGHFWVVGRMDDVINVSGHRLGTAEVESALVSHKAVAEAAVVGRPDDLKGQALVVFAILKKGHEPSEKLKAELREHVGKSIGGLAKPDDLYFVPALPKTRSGKIIRRLLKELVTSGTITGNITTIEDSSVLDDLKKTLQTP